MLRRALTWGLVLLVLAYSVLIAQSLLAGVAVAAFIYLASWLLAVSPVTRKHLRTPQVAVGIVVAVLVLAYSLLITRALLVGTLVAAFVLFVAFLTGPVADSWDLTD